MSRSSQTFFRNGEAKVAEKDTSIVCSELFEDLGGEVIPLADTEVECQRVPDVYSFVQNNHDMDRRHR